MKKIENKHGVINTVTDSKYDYLMKSEQGYKEVKPKRKKKVEPKQED